MIDVPHHLLLLLSILSLSKTKEQQVRLMGFLVISAIVINIMTMLEIHNVQKWRNIPESFF